MTKKILSLLTALLLLALPALAAVPSASDDFYVLDEADVLTEDTEWRIVYNNDLLYDACGAQICIVTVDSTDSESIDDYTYDMFNSWGIGSSEKNNGFLLLMAIDDDNYYAVAGTGLESTLSSGTIKSMLDEYLEPDFAAKDYDSGAVKFFDAVFNKISGIYSAGLTAVTPEAYSESGSSSTVTERNGGGGNFDQDAPDNGGYDDQDEHEGGIFSIILGVIIFIVLVIIFITGAFRMFFPARPFFGRYRSYRNPPPPPPGGPHGFGGGPRGGFNDGPRGGGFGGGFGGGAGRSSGSRSSFGSGAGRSSGSRSSFGGGAGRSGGGHSGGFGGGRSGGGGGSRGGGAGRGR